MLSLLGFCCCYVIAFDVTAAVIIGAVVGAVFVILTLGIVVFAVAGSVGMLKDKD